jgi:hypothetical protein
MPKTYNLELGLYERATASIEAMSQLENSSEVCSAGRDEYDKFMGPVDVSCSSTSERDDSQRGSLVKRPYDQNAYISPIVKKLTQYSWYLIALPTMLPLVMSVQGSEAHLNGQLNGQLLGQII